MRTLPIILAAALLALATPVTAEDLEPDTAIDCGWCCFLGTVDYAQCMGDMVYDGLEPAGPAGQISGAYWDATMFSVDVAQGTLERVQVDAGPRAADAGPMDCGWCCGLGTIDYAQCMGTMLYDGAAPGGPVGQIAGAYWDATMFSVDVVQEIDAVEGRSSQYGCGGTTVPDDVVCFVSGVEDPVLYCYGTAGGVVTCVVNGELENWRQFNRNVCDHHFCLLP